MHARLPKYIVNCLLAAGFDDAEVIASMDTSINPANSITQVEQYIQTTFPGNSQFCNPALPDSTMPLQFPPGHRMRIANFVRDVKESFAAKKAKHQTQIRLPIKRPSMKAEREEPKKSEIRTTEVKSASDVRLQVVKCIDTWKAKQSNEYLRNLEVDVHYAVIVETGSTNCQVVKVRCIPCNNLVTLQNRQTDQAQFVLSNWSRHVRKCSKITVPRSPHKQSTLNHFTQVCSNLQCIYLRISTYLHAGFSPGFQEGIVL